MAAFFMICEPNPRLEKLAVFNERLIYFQYVLNIRSPIVR